MPQPKHLAVNIDSIINLDKAFDKPYKMQDCLDIPFEVQSATFTKGREGEYAVLTVLNYLTNESHKLNCGGVVLLNIFKEINAVNRFPVSVVFYQEPQNRMYFCRGVEASDFPE